MSSAKLGFIVFMWIIILSLYNYASPVLAVVVPIYIVMLVINILLVIVVIYTLSIFHKNNQLNDEIGVSICEAIRKGKKSWIRFIEIISSLILVTLAYMSGFYLLFALEAISEILNILIFNSISVNATENT